MSDVLAVARGTVETSSRDAQGSRAEGRVGAGPGPSAWRRWGIVAVATALLIPFLLAALWPELFTTRDPEAVELGAEMLPPGRGHPFGTDQTGRDVFARVVAGARISLSVGIAAAASAGIVGLSLGVLIGLVPRLVDTVLMRVLEVLLAFPDFLIALAVVAILGPGAGNVVLAVFIGAIPLYTRLARIETLTIRQREYVQASLLLGIPIWRVAVRHIVPGVAPRIAVVATLGIGGAMVSAAGLGYLGLGAQEPTPEWGLMLAGSRNVIGQAWWLMAAPGGAICLSVLTASAVSLALRRLLSAHGRQP